MTTLKSERKIYLLNNGQVIKEYPVSLGLNPVGHKFQKGDQRTPEGVYVLTHRNSKSKYYKSILFSYPNEQDRRLAKARGVDPGGDGVTGWLAGDAVSLYQRPDRSGHQRKPRSCSNRTELTAGRASRSARHCSLWLPSTLCLVATDGSPHRVLLFQ